MKRFKFAKNRLFQNAFRNLSFRMYNRIGETTIYSKKIYGGIFMKKIVLIFSMCLSCMLNWSGVCGANWSHAYSSQVYVNSDVETHNYVVSEENPNVSGYKSKIALPDTWYKVGTSSGSFLGAFTYDPVTKIFACYGDDGFGEGMEKRGEFKFIDDSQLEYTSSVSDAFFSAGEKVLMKDKSYFGFCGKTMNDSNTWLAPYFTDAALYVLHNR